MSLVTAHRTPDPPAVARNDVPLLVEFVGLAGVGKSTLVRELQRRDPRIATLQRAHHPHHAPGMAIDALRFAPSWGASLPAAPHFVWRSARYYLRLQGLRRVAREVLADSPGAVVLEHGPVFTLARIAILARGVAPPGPLRRYTRRSLAHWAQLLDLIVILDADRVELARRVRARAKAHVMRHSADHVIHDFFDRYGAAYAAVLADVAAAGGPPVLELRTDQHGIPALADRILAALEVAQRAAR